LTSSASYKWEDLCFFFRRAGPGTLLPLPSSNFPRHMGSLSPRSQGNASDLSLFPFKQVLGSYHRCFPNRLSSPFSLFPACTRHFSFPPLEVMRELVSLRFPDRKNAGVRFPRKFFPPLSPPQSNSPPESRDISPFFFNFSKRIEYPIFPPSPYELPEKNSNFSRLSPSLPLSESRSVVVAAAFSFLRADAVGRSTLPLMPTRSSLLLPSGERLRAFPQPEKFVEPFSFFLGRLRKTEYLLPPLRRTMKDRRRNRWGSCRPSRGGERAPYAPIPLLLSGADRTGGSAPSFSLGQSRRW